MTNASKLRVLWASDGSAAARNAAPLLKSIVLPAAEKLVVLSVAPHSVLSGARPDPAFLTRVTRSAKTRALASATEIATAEATVLDPAVPVEAIARWGNPIEVILRAARQLDVDLIVLGAKGHSNLAMILLGSVSQGVVQHATLPVLIARPGAKPVRRVVVGYHGSAASKKALTFLGRLALANDTEVMLTTVIEPFGVPQGTPTSYRRRAIEEAHKINLRRHAAAERSLAAVRTKLPWRVTTRVLAGDPGPVLDGLARETGADLIVVGSRRPSPMRHYLLGSTAEKLVLHAHASVLVVR